MGIFYTGKGDKGKSYVGTKSVSKTCLEVEALGQLDELNSMIGVLKSQKIDKKLKKMLHQVQENLFTIQANIAHILFGGKYPPPPMAPSKIKEIESIIDGIEEHLPPIKNFIIAGSNNISAWLDFLRAKSRNVERSVLKTKKQDKLSNEIKSYLNRLSSLFFALARWEARRSKEKKPLYK